MEHALLLEARLARDPSTEWNGDTDYRLRVLQVLPSGAPQVPSSEFTCVVEWKRELGKAPRHVDDVAPAPYVLIKAGMVCAVMFRVWDVSLEGGDGRVVLGLKIIRRGV